MNDLINKLNNNKYNLLKKEVINLNSINVYDDIMNIIKNIPQNVSPKEKARWVYLQLGKIFSYDYRVAYDSKYAYSSIESNKYICRYQTCIQVSEILNYILNKIDGIKSTVIPRHLENLRGHYDRDHLANKVEIQIDGNTKEVYLFDLTLDLFYIQSGLKTKHFGFETDIYSTYDIIPQIDNQEMDNKLGIQKNSFDTEDIIKKLKNEFLMLEKKLSSEELINYELDKINLLLKDYNGYFEGKQFIIYLFNNIFSGSYKEYNLYYFKDEYIDLKTCFKIQYKDYEKWIMYSKTFGIIEIDKNIIKYFLDNEYETKSKDLLNELEGNCEKTK